jgi:hypothetical protein
MAFEVIKNCKVPALRPGRPCSASKDVQSDEDKDIFTTFVTIQLPPPYKRRGV